MLMIALRTIRVFLSEKKRFNESRVRLELIQGRIRPQVKLAAEKRSA